MRIMRKTNRRKKKSRRNGRRKRMRRWKSTGIRSSIWKKRSGDRLQKRG
jgi:hypothetical protein